MSLELKFSAFGGDTIEDTCRELCRLATSLDVVATCDFNGVKLMACAGDSAASLEDEWRRELASDVPYKIARAKLRDGP